MCRLFAFRRTTYTSTVSHRTPGAPVSSPLTLQCSHRFLIALRTFIPRACCLWKTATPLCTAGAIMPAAAALDAAVLEAQHAEPSAAWDRLRVWTSVDAAGRAAAGAVVGARERARIDAARDLVADEAAERAVCERIGRLGMVSGGLGFVVVVLRSLVAAGGRSAGIEDWRWDGLGDCLAQSRGVKTTRGWTLTLGFSRQGGLV